MRPTLIRAENLSKSFGGTTVFQSVSFEIRAGEHMALVGPSGCGKSTLLRLVAGLESLTEGCLWLHDKMISGPGQIVVRPHEREMGMVFQDLALWPTLSAVENVVLGMAGLGLPGRECRAQALEALRSCYIDQFAQYKPAALSVGQQQRVALARAMAVRPKLLLLDEPFSSLDLPLKQELMAEFNDLAARFGVTMLLVTHDPGEARGVCSRALVLEDGRICERGGWDELMAKPVSRTLRAFARCEDGIERGCRNEGE